MLACLKFYFSMYEDTIILTILLSDYEFYIIGDLDKSASFLEQSLETTKLVYGERSVEVGNELSKLAGVFFNNHQMAKAMAVINQSIDILQMHYGENHSSLWELTEMKNCLMQLEN